MIMISLAEIFGISFSIVIYRDTKVLNTSLKNTQSKLKKHAAK